MTKNVETSIYLSKNTQFLDPNIHTKQIENFGSLFFSQISLLP